MKISIPAVPHNGLSPKNSKECSISLVINPNNIICVVQGEFYHANTYVNSEDYEEEDLSEDKLNYHYTKKILLKNSISSIVFNYEYEEDLWYIEIISIYLHIAIPFKNLDLAKTTLKKIEEWMEI